MEHLNQHVTWSLKSKVNYYTWSLPFLLNVPLTQLKLTNEDTVLQYMDKLVGN